MLENAMIIALPYKNLKHRNKLTEKYSKNYSIIDLNGVLYMKKRGEIDGKG